jgi:hypothetical protein
MERAIETGVQKVRLSGRGLPEFSLARGGWAWIAVKVQKLSLANISTFFFDKPWQQVSFMHPPGREAVPILYYICCMI